uniref:Trafficking protein particle complex subunit 5 n=1 Tax=Globodera rostochiensis TaxID=31243 RepID=A0A914HYV7_GLORO
MRNSAIRTVGILDKSLSKGKHEVNLSTFALFFVEMVRYAQNKVNTVQGLQDRLTDYGRFVGVRLLDLITLREKGYKRDVKLLHILMFVKGPVWKNLFGQEADKLERSNEDPCKYFLIEKEPIVNTFISLPKDKGSLNCAAFIAGIIEAFLTESNFPCKVTAHWHMGTAYMIEFEEEVILREKMEAVRMAQHGMKKKTTLPAGAKQKSMKRVQKGAQYSKGPKKGAKAVIAPKKLAAVQQAKANAEISRALPTNTKAERAYSLGIFESRASGEGWRKPILGFSQRKQATSSANSSALKWISLVVLIAQTTALVLTLRYSRTQRSDASDGPKYLSSTAVLMSEIVKFFTCIVVLVHQNKWNFGRFWRDLDAKDSLKVGVPALFYVVQNNLLFLALSKLDAATYQVTYQLKILTTAFFSVTMLNKKLDLIKWLALLLLTSGVALVQLPKGSSGSPSTASSSRVEDAVGTDNENQKDAAGDGFVGLFAILAACCSSGFAGVYLEKILKTSQVQLWVRNLQLAFFSIFGAFAMTWIYDWGQVQQWGFFQGYNWIIWLVVALQAYGGLVVALVVKYADNILKGFAVSLSILLSSFVSWAFLDDFEPSLSFVLGASIVIFSTFLYGYEPKQPSQPERHSA